MNSDTVDMLHSEFRAYWIEWRKTRSNVEQELQARIAEEFVTLSVSDDPLFHTGLLTTQGLLLYRSYVPLGHETNQLNGEERETQVSAGTRPDSQVADN